MPFEQQHENIISADSSVFSSTRSKPLDTSYMRKANLYSSIMGPLTRRSTAGTPFVNTSAQSGTGLKPKRIDVKRRKTNESVESNYFMHLR